MSKVHEALKRAQEERSIVAQQVNSDNDLDGLEAPSIPVHSSLSIVATAPVSVAPPPTTGPGPSSRASAQVAPTCAPPSPFNPTVVASAPVPEGPILAGAAVGPRQHAATIGRDPKMGHFLRFEDLLRTCAKPAWVLDPRMVVFCESKRQMSGAEQFRTLRTRLYHHREATPLKKVLVTSAVAAEGKTFVATNLAQAIACECDRRVLLIDADLRNPTLHQPLGAPLSPGLSDYLRDQASDADVIQHGREGNLCFIAAGSPGSNPSELLSNGGFEKLLDRITPLFDWVIIDSPPCLPVADANVIAKLCDGVLLIVRARSTSSAAVDRARKELQKRKVIGVVMNGVEEIDAYGSYYAYGKEARRIAKS